MHRANSSRASSGDSDVVGEGGAVADAVVDAGAGADADGFAVVPAAVATSFPSSPVHPAVASINDTVIIKVNLGILIVTSP
ncbi:hypothetical protein [Actinomadura pelletieri]|uniref:hypothetical protein n=1 Tax=Actinomadura pelletieri TaxID=111805 RepID=UPI000EB53017|nr:hypothetical protein [Actinomadura pelletieri]